MTRLAALSPFCFALLDLCATEEVGVGNQSIQVRNEDPSPIEVLVSDNDECVIGMHSTVQPSTTRQFDVAEGAYLCAGGRGLQIKDGGTYVIEGGAISQE